MTQLTSTDDLAAPTGCLQYFTEGEGILESFNYRDKSEIGIPRVPSYLVSIKEPEWNKLYKFPWFLDHGQKQKRSQTSYYYYLLGAVRPGRLFLGAATICFILGRKESMKKRGWHQYQYAIALV